MKDEKLIVRKTNIIYADDSIFKALITTTAWTNGEGFDLSICSKNGGMQSMLIAYSEFDLIKKMVKKLDKTPLSE